MALAWIPPDTLFTRTDEYRWVWSIFDLAWQGQHPSLRAERKTWFLPREPIPNVEPNVVYVPYDRQQLRSMREGALASVFNFPEEWIERLPGYFISELPDLFQASADLVDTLLDLAEHADGKPAQVVPAQARVARPTWERLEIIEQRSGNDLAILDGQEYRLPSKAADLLIALQEAKGQMVLADTLTKTCGKRADHIYRSLPDELRPIIDAPGKTGQGYRMK